MNLDLKKQISNKNLFFYFFLLIIGSLFLYKFSEVKNVVHLFEEIKPLWFLLAITAQFLTYFFTANTYYYILKIYNQEKIFSKWELFKLSIVILFINQIIPAAGLSGNGFLVYFLEKRNLDSKKGLTVVILELFTYYASHLVFLILGFGYVIFLLHENLSQYIIGVGIIGACIFIALNVAILFFGNNRVIEFVNKTISKYRILNFVFKKFKLKSQKNSHIENVDSPWNIVKNKSKKLILPILFQGCVILSDAVTILILFFGFNCHPAFSAIVTGLILTKIIAMLSIVPGSLIFFEGSMIIFYSAFGIPIETAVVVTLMFRALSFWLPIPIGLFLYKDFNKIDAK